MGLYHAPGRHSAYERRGVVLATAVTRRHLVVARSVGSIVNVAWNQPQMEALHVSLDDKQRLLIAELRAPA